MKTFLPYQKGIVKLRQSRLESLLTRASTQRLLVPPFL